MIDALWIRSSFVAGIAAFGGLVTAHAFVTGCGSGTQESPPSTQAQAQTAAPADSTATGDPAMHHHHTPPPAAFDACKDKAVGDACSVSMHDREIHGKCDTAPPGSSQTGPACRPEWGQHGEGRPHGPPPEIVFAACDGKTAGDACSVTFERGTVQGSCLAPHIDGGAGRLLCAAAHGKHGAGGGT